MKKWPLISKFYFVALSFYFLFNSFIGMDCCYSYLRAMSITMIMFSMINIIMAYKNIYMYKCLQLVLNINCTSIIIIFFKSAEIRVIECLMIFFSYDGTIVFCFAFGVLVCVVLVHGGGKKKPLSPPTFPSKKWNHRWPGSNQRVPYYFV